VIIFCEKSPQTQPFQIKFNLSLALTMVLFLLFGSLFCFACFAEHHKKELPADNFAQISLGTTTIGINGQIHLSPPSLTSYTVSNASMSYLPDKTLTRGSLWTFTPDGMYFTVQAKYISNDGSLSMTFTSGRDTNNAFCAWSGAMSPTISIGFGAMLRNTSNGQQLYCDFLLTQAC